MNEHEHERELEVSRILLARDASARGLAAMRAAAELAASLRAELDALFVEDIDLLRLAELPFAREVGFFSAAGRPLGFEELERTLRAQAARMQRLLDEAAKRLHLQFRFNVARGRVLPEVMAKAGDVDLVVLGKAVRALEPRLGAPESGGRPVLALFDGGSGSYRVLSAALRLAAKSGRRLTLLVPEPNPRRFAEIRGRAQDWLKRRGQSARVQQAPGSGFREVLKALRSLRGDALVLPIPRGGIAEEELDALLGAVACPVLLVR
jgi:nucleotide-binding universal stress UspA family protein